jgi:polyisoprenoid-binding protein YceI
MTLKNQSIKIFAVILGLFLSAANLLNAQGVKLVSDMVHSNVGFSVPLAGGLTRITGKFNNWEVIVQYVDSDMTKSTIKATIKAASINTGDPGRDEHLAAADFFDAAKYPDITFESDSLIKRKDTYAAFGTFQFHGISKKIVLEFKIVGKDSDGAVGFSARHTIRRSDYKIGDNPEGDNYVSNDIDVEIDFLAKKPREKPKQ